MCLLGVSMMNNHIQGSKVPKTSSLGAWIGISSQICELSSDMCIRLIWNLTGSCGQQQRLRGWSHMVAKQFQDGGRPPFWKSIYRHISVKIIGFYDILYTSADFELYERHVIKNEKVALDRLRVRQNVFLVFRYTVIVEFTRDKTEIPRQGIYFGRLWLCIVAMFVIL